MPLASRWRAYAVFMASPILVFDTPAVRDIKISGHEVSTILQKTSWRLHRHKCCNITIPLCILASGHVMFRHLCSRLRELGFCTGVQNYVPTNVYVTRLYFLAEVRRQAPSLRAASSCAIQGASLPASSPDRPFQNLRSLLCKLASAELVLSK